LAELNNGHALVATPLLVISDIQNTFETIIDLADHWALIQGHTNIAAPLVFRSVIDPLNNQTRHQLVIFALGGSRIPTPELLIFDVHTGELVNAIYEWPRASSYPSEDGSLAARVWHVAVAGDNVIVVHPD
jgi:hypothetical protein